MPIAVYNDSINIDLDNRVAYLLSDTKPLQAVSEPEWSQAIRGYDSLQKQNYLINFTHELSIQMCRHECHIYLSQ